MTLPSGAKPFHPRLPNALERETAGQLRSIIANAKAQNAEGATIKIADLSGKQAELVLPPLLTEVLLDVLRAMGGGRAVSIVPLDEMLTTQQAADILNVSRPYLISKLIDNNVIPHEKQGRHRRIRARDVFDYKSRRDSQRSETLDRLAAEDADFL